MIPGKKNCFIGYRPFNISSSHHAIRSGSLKKVGVFFTLDAEALASPENLLKVNLALCSLWASGLILVKPRTDCCKTERQDSGIVPFAYIPAIAGEVNQAFDKLQKLLRNTRGTGSWQCTTPAS